MIILFISLLPRWAVGKCYWLVIVDVLCIEPLAKFRCFLLGCTGYWLVELVRSAYGTDDNITEEAVQLNTFRNDVAVERMPPKCKSSIEDDVDAIRVFFSPLSERLIHLG